MSEQKPNENQRQPGQDEDHVGDAHDGRRIVSLPGGRYWILPTLTFLVGAILSGLAFGLADSGNNNKATAPPTQTQTQPGPSTAPSGRPAGTYTVPGPCLDVADRTQELLSLVSQAATAAKDLDASKLSDIVRQIQDSQDNLQARASACQSSAAALPTSSP